MNSPWTKDLVDFGDDPELGILPVDNCCFSKPGKQRTSEHKLLERLQLCKLEKRSALAEFSALQRVCSYSCGCLFLTGIGNEHMSNAASLTCFLFELRIGPLHTKNKQYYPRMRGVVWRSNTLIDFLFSFRMMHCVVVSSRGCQGSRDYLDLLVQR